MGYALGFQHLPLYFPVKESVEKNLLSDIGLAIHSGISLDELLGDLTDTGKSKDNTLNRHW